MTGSETTSTHTKHVVFQVANPGLGPASESAESSESTNMTGGHFSASEAQSTKITGSHFSASGDHAESLESTKMTGGHFSASEAQSTKMTDGHFFFIGGPRRILGVDNNYRRPFFCIGGSVDKHDRRSFLCIGGNNYRRLYFCIGGSVDNIVLLDVPDRLLLWMLQIGSFCGRSRSALWRFSQPSSKP